MIRGCGGSNQPFSGKEWFWLSGFGTVCALHHKIHDLLYESSLHVLPGNKWQRSEQVDRKKKGDQEDSSGTVKSTHNGSAVLVKPYAMNHKSNVERSKWSVQVANGATGQLKYLRRNESCRTSGLGSSSGFNQMQLFVDEKELSVTEVKTTTLRC
ncbi:hypothetical protein F2P81_021101 [Scophthalmus maximus]|uniref:Uncharacterized protein n=1 Tax=Scophthalmus maximus TaxID=52904 RepID=A0A6A4S707_SCOMX|nr:hypothetical protein F2P81_021101 [Scophthalmus maximus]